MQKRQLRRENDNDTQGKKVIDWLSDIRTILFIVVTVISIGIIYANMQGQLSAIMRSVQDSGGTIINIREIKSKMTVNETNINELQKRLIIMGKDLEQVVKNTDKILKSVEKE